LADAPCRYLLKVLAADGASVRCFHLGPGEHVVGSLRGAAVRIAEPGVSRRHARLDVLSGGGAVVRDLGSKNGTFVGGRRIREAAVSGFALLAFGSVQAALQPADPARDRVLLGPGEPVAASAGPDSQEGLTTSGLRPLERLAESLEEVLPALAEGLPTPEEAATELAHRWLAVLPVGRVELLRSGPAGETLVAAASTSDALPRNAASFDVEGPHGWRLRLRAPASVELAPLRPLFRLALASLAASRRRTVPVQAERSRPAAKGDLAPPPGLGAEMAKLYRRAGKVARGGVPVLILGESGSGKEVLARWLHARSPRAAGPFLAVNCAALPRELLEAELFGIEKGVATGVEARAGLLERASGGTVFLDEVADMAAETQAKVLRVLESTSLYRVGGKAPVQVDVRFIAATNRDLETLVEAASFRRDLYHRLAAFEVKLPPLRERREEIPSLAAGFFHRELEKDGVASPGITRAALGALVRYAWPGNVRELQNEIAQAALLLERGEPLDLQHLSPRIRGAAGGPPALLTLDETVRRAEREAFAVALAAAEGDAGRAMELLGVSRTTYYRKLKELGLP
jgi:DNA-binding NtrC family response regulator